jgi:hypothetical protein
MIVQPVADENWLYRRQTAVVAFHQLLLFRGHRSLGLEVISLRVGS